MKVVMKTGKALKNSGAKGKKPIYETHQVEIIGDTKWRTLYNASRYLPHFGEKQKEKATRNAK